MTYFLDKIASHLYAEFGERLDRHCLVFPNRRAGLYFLKYLAGKINKPIWSPEIKTINELFQSFTSKRVADNELLVFELFKVYKELNKNAGSIDDFFFWGDMLINDFDDIDKYLVDPSKLFINIENLKEIDAKFGGLTDDQVRIIRQFWVNFNPDAPTNQKAGFREIWSVLLPLYEKFRDSISEKGIAYEGMMYRHLAEQCKKGEVLQINWDKIHFIGFNALNTCEKLFMSHLKNSGQASFYWDYDESFVFNNPAHSAGYFIRENLKIYGNDMPLDWPHNSMSSADGSRSGVSVIDCSSDTAQVKLASKMIEESYSAENKEPHHTAIVLADENLLLPMLSSLPENTANINVTMGYPIKFSPVYSLILDLLNLQKTVISDNKGEIFFDVSSVKKVLSNSFFAEKPDFKADSLLSDISDSRALWISGSFFTAKIPSGLIFRKVSSARELSAYIKTILENLYILSEGSEGSDSVAVGISIKNEFIYRVILVINRLEAILGGSNPEISVKTYCSLLNRILRGLSIPFTGEPLNGIQIMGLLETRSLDFKNLIMLSVNEGILPRNSASNSFIPFNLREAFGLPTIRHQDSIYSYYFYRLLQRAEHLTFIYNSSSDGIKTGEKSRFLLQLEYSEKPPYSGSQRFEIRASSRVPKEIHRKKEHIDKLKRTYLEGERRLLSPSAVDTWLMCRMKFYYIYVCGLRETKKVSADIDSAAFGELLHLCMEKLYSPYKKQILNKEKVESIIRDDAGISRIIYDSINEKIYNLKRDKLSGNDLIIFNILKTYIRQILRLDERIAPLEIIALEHRISSERKIVFMDKPYQVRIGGVIDRLDRSGKSLRITDYKTGKIVMEIPSIDSLFDESQPDRNNSWFQLLMYCSIYFSESNDTCIRPAIYPVRNIYSEDFSDYLVIKDHYGQALVLDDYSAVKDLFDSGLVQTIANIFDPQMSFSMTENLRKCSFCPYVRLCQR